MTIDRVLYRLARIIGDVRAARRGRLGRRLANRAKARAIWRLTRPLFRR